MTTRLSAEEARENFSDVLGRVCDGQEPIIVERKGKPVAVLISPEQYERYERYVMEQLRKTVDELRRLNADIDPDEGFRDVSAIVEEVRREQYEREHRSG